jgi:hypothetical protein
MSWLTVSKDAGEYGLFCTTLYHCLRKVERLCGVDMEASEDRLRMDPRDAVIPEQALNLANRVSDASGSR